MKAFTWSESLRQNSIKRLAEVMPISESIQKLIAKKQVRKLWDLGDDLGPRRSQSRLQRRLRLLKPTQTSLPLSCE